MRAQTSAIGLTVSEAAPEEPCQVRSAHRHRFIRDRGGRKADAASGIAQPVEKILVFAARASKFNAESQVFVLDRLSPDQHVARVPGFDPSTNEHGPRGVKIA